MSLKAGDAKVQVRWIDQNGTAWATEIADITVGRVLLERVIEWGGDEP